MLQFAKSPVIKDLHAYRIPMDSYAKYQYAENVSSPSDASGCRRNGPNNRGFQVEIAAVETLFRPSLIGIRKEPALG
jgi:hypothetical protein